MTTAVLWVILAVLSASLLGILLLATGWRGRRVNDHPICRRCGFDLSGLPQGADVCSECGANLKARRAIRCGARQRRAGRILLGCMLLLPAAGATGMVGVARARHLDLNPYKPVWWLVSDANNSDTAVHDAAFAELLKRQAAGRLSRSNVRMISRSAIRAQADLTRPWSPQWGMLVQGAHRANMLDADQWQAYAAQTIIAPGFKVRPAVGRGELLSMDLDFNVRKDRDGQEHASGFIGTGLIRWFIDGNPVPIEALNDGDRANSDDVRGLNDVMIAGTLMRYQYWISIEDTLHLRDGLHEVSAAFDGDVQYYDETNPAKKLKEEKIAKTRFTMRQSWMLLAEGTSSITILDPDAHPEVPATPFKLVVLRYPTHCTIAQDWGFDDPLQTVGMAYRIYVRDGSREVPVGNLWFKSGERTASINTAPRTSGYFPGKTADIVLRPDVVGATADLQMTTIWGAELSFKNVPIQ